MPAAPSQAPTASLPALRQPFCLFKKSRRSHNNKRTRSTRVVQRIQKSLFRSPTIRDPVATRVPATVLVLLPEVSAKTTSQRSPPQLAGARFWARDSFPLSPAAPPIHIAGSPKLGVQRPARRHMQPRSAGRGMKPKTSAPRPSPMVVVGGWELPCDMGSVVGGRM